MLLAFHALFIVFVVVGFAIILAGIANGWSWTRNIWFRALHLAAIAIVVLQAWLGWRCPLTVWEAALRRRAFQEPQEGSFVQYWLQRLIFYEAEPWVFVVAYSAFGVAVLLAYIVAPPRWPRGRSSSAAERRS